MHFVPLEAGKARPPDQDSKELWGLAREGTPSWAREGELRGSGRESRAGNLRGPRRGRDGGGKKKQHSTPAGYKLDFI